MTTPPTVTTTVPTAAVITTVPTGCTHNDTDGDDNDDYCKTNNNNDTTTSGTNDPDRNHHHHNNVVTVVDDATAVPVVASDAAAAAAAAVIASNDDTKPSTTPTPILLRLQLQSPPSSLPQQLPPPMVSPPIRFVQQQQQPLPSPTKTDRLRNTTPTTAATTATSSVPWPWRWLPQLQPQPQHRLHHTTGSGGGITSSAVESKSVALLKEEHYSNNNNNNTCCTTDATFVDDEPQQPSFNAVRQRRRIHDNNDNDDLSLSKTCGGRILFGRLRRQLPIGIAAIVSTGTTVFCCTHPLATHRYTAAVMTVSILMAMVLGAVLSPKFYIPHVRIAMIGNSMMYYNDFPRFMEELSDGHITQNSCLHGNANFRTILQMGNGMYNLWYTGNARIVFNSHHMGPIHDFGACTVKQLLFGYDAALEQRVQQIFGNIDYYDIDADDAVTDSGATADESNNDDIDDDNDDDSTDDAQAAEYEKEYGDDYFSYNDGSNPCLRNLLYYKYLMSYVYSYHPDSNTTTTTSTDWDYILLNDNTRSPARNESRYDMLEILQETYLPWFIESGAVPIFLATYGYWTPYRDMGGLDSVAEFTSLTMAGYQTYVDLLTSQLPPHQQPRIAPVGLAFLLVWEESPSLWERLFHVDQIHSGPLGTYLQGLIVHHTIFGKLPKYSVAVRGDMSYLWYRARRFQPVEHHTDPYPTQEEAAYLYQIAVRITVYKHVPKSYIVYQNGEASDYDPVDDVYKVDDLF